MTIKDLDYIKLEVRLNIEIDKRSIIEDITERIGDEEFTRSELMELCRKHVEKNPEILEMFDIAIVNKKNTSWNYA